MIFNLNNPLDEENYKLQCNRLFKKVSPNGTRPIIEMTEKGTRTLEQNAYLHVILRYFGAMYGCTENEAKEDFFKEIVNPDIFLMGHRTDRLTGRNKPILRHSSMIGKEDMTKCIDRFLNWSAQVAGIYLPRADEREKVAICEAEAKRCEGYMYN